MAEQSVPDRPATDVGPDRNLVILSGALSRPPEVRTLPSGDTLVAYEVTSRPAAGGGALTVPVTCASRQAPVDLDVGAEVVVTGVVRRRYFRAGGTTQSRTEVVADAVVPARQAAKARRAIERALAGAGLPA
jgi:single-strand DNA-binding protein